MDTHLKKESKIKWFEGDRENLQFVDQNAQDAFNAYKELQLEKYGVDADVHIVDGPDLWKQSLLQRGVVMRPGRTFGVGASYIHYLMTGTCYLGPASSGL